MPTEGSAMELDWIEDFLVLAESGIFSKAALRRNVTQSAFTRRAVPHRLFVERNPEP